MFNEAVFNRKHLLADFVLESPSMILPRKHYLFEVKGYRTLLWLRLDPGH